MPKRRFKSNPRKHVLRLERALKGATPERIANFERHMSAKEKLGRNSDVSYALKSAAQMYIISERSVRDLEKYEAAQRRKGLRSSLKRKLGI